MDLEKQMRLMVAYVIDTDDNEVIDDYTKTFVNIAKQYATDLKPDLLNPVIDCCKQIDNLELTNNWGVRRCKECGNLVNTSGR